MSANSYPSITLPGGQGEPARQSTARIKAARQPAYGSYPVDCLVVWRWGWGKTYSQLHVLGRTIDGDNHRMTACGCLARPMPDSERAMFDFRFGDDALATAAEHSLAVCPECFKT